MKYFKNVQYRKDEYRYRQALKLVTRKRKLFGGLPLGYDKHLDGFLRKANICIPISVFPFFGKKGMGKLRRPTWRINSPTASLRA